MIEREQSFVDQCGEKLDDKEWIAGGLLMHKPGQGSGAAAVQGRSAAAPAPTGEPAPQSADAQQFPRPVWLVELDHQPPEKWLAQLAAFRRDARVSDADTLLAEFRRRFPDHPASAR